MSAGVAVLANPAASQARAPATMIAPRRLLGPAQPRDDPRGRVDPRADREAAEHQVGRAGRQAQQQRDLHEPERDRPRRRAARAPRRACARACAGARGSAPGWARRRPVARPPVPIPRGTRSESGHREGHGVSGTRARARSRPTTLRLPVQPGQAAHPVDLLKPDDEERAPTRLASARDREQHETAMAVAVHITAHGMSKDDYARVMGELQATGDGEPDGRIHHTAYGDDEVHMFEVWDSPEQFQAHQDKRFALIQVRVSTRASSTCTPCTRTRTNRRPDRTSSASWWPGHVSAMRSAPRRRQSMPDGPRPPGTARVTLGPIRVVPRMRHADPQVPLLDGIARDPEDLVPVLAGGRRPQRIVEQHGDDAPRAADNVRHRLVGRREPPTSPRRQGPAPDVASTRDRGCDVIGPVAMWRAPSTSSTASRALMRGRPCTASSQCHRHARACPPRSPTAWPSPR